MQYDITPIPTLYKGIKFRSKLEAQWACFFDYAGWNWDYEPYEINGKIPDFVIHYRSKAYQTKTLFIEVKPQIFITEEYIKYVIKHYCNIQAHIIIVSEHCIEPSISYPGFFKIGIGNQYLNSDIYELSEIHWKLAYDIGSLYMIFDGMIVGEGERKNFLQDFFCDEKDVNLIRRSWILSRNNVQFSSY